MDAPPDTEDCRPFIQVASYLRAMNLTVPQVLQANLDLGYLLLSDLGSVSYLEALTMHRDSSTMLYDDAIATLLTLQRNGIRFQNALPPYNYRLLSSELAIFQDWLCSAHLGIELTKDEARAWLETGDFLISNALQQPVVFVHRDYHSRNLMVIDENNPGVLDFQDAVAGPYTYDLVSLLKDCYIAWPQEKVSRWALSFYRAREAELADSIDEETFMRHFELMGVQRQLKAAGIFARLHHRDRKSSYLMDIPRTLNYIVEIAPRYPELDFLAKLIRERILPALAGPIS